MDIVDILVVAWIKDTLHIIVVVWIQDTPDIIQATFDLSIVVYCTYE